ncbi:hypothetical protein SAMN04489724_3556 [Algoriphagus locisalis]|uniref:Lipocalin-like domain-containing protein n=1 Tax=Algoriphagus locisalis TaxID=305507 RepID=A0A1I7CXN0_9BACT|nr:hypothetical protein [Algoriphagus locisalis]SFU04203.1 hypothetical protein SAMN04489724_3556 [Algoriphagus locisalis]
MKTFHRLSFLFALASLVSFSSCTDGEDSDPPKSEAELIGSGVAWKFSTVTAAGIDAKAFIDDCHLDNLITFNYETPISIGVVDSGPTKCDDAAPQTSDFTWSYNETSKVLTIDTDLIEIPGASGDLNVESVSSSELVLSQSVALPGFGTQEVIVTLIH